jgi:proline iminopeptidase
MTSARERFVAYRRSLPRTPPLERQTVRVRGLAFAVFSSPPVEGTTPLVAINGGLLYDHAMLWPALSQLAQGRQVILYDQRGRGLSEAPADPTSACIDDDAADVGALRRALGVRRWDVLGHSWGGGIAMLGAAMDPGGTRRLVTVDAVGPTSAWMSPLREAVLTRLTGAKRQAVEAITEEQLGNPDPELQAAYARAVYPAWFADSDLAAYFAPPKTTSITGAVILARLRREGYDWRHHLRALSAPTFVFHGEQDALPVEVSEDLTSLLAHPRRALIPDSGHMPFWEAPERFFALLDSFLAAPQLSATPPPT